MNAKFSRRTVLKRFTGVMAGAALLTTGEGLLTPLAAQAADNSWNVSPGSTKLAQVAETLRQWRLTPGKGAGTQNIEDPKRITAAKKLAGKQAA
ncbi:hypothetical protein [Streptomyces sp. NPDC055506]